jgi:hypothetical protein
MELKITIFKQNKPDWERQASPALSQMWKLCLKKSEWHKYKIEKIWGWEPMRGEWSKGDYEGQGVYMTEVLWAHIKSKTMNPAKNL